jgi:hypothetical protein
MRDQREVAAEATAVHASRERARAEMAREQALTNELRREVAAAQFERTAGATAYARENERLAAVKQQLDAQAADARHKAMLRAEAELEARARAVVANQFAMSAREDQDHEQRAWRERESARVQHQADLDRISAQMAAEERARLIAETREQTLAAEREKALAEERRMVDAQRRAKELVAERAARFAYANEPYRPYYGAATVGGAPVVASSAPVVYSNGYAASPARRVIVVDSAQDALNAAHHVFV